MAAIGKQARRFPIPVVPENLRRYAIADPDGDKEAGDRHGPVARPVATAKRPGKPRKPSKA